jgi:hypothetical protein
MNEDLNLSNYILDFNFSIPKDLRNNFQGIFSYIKKKFQIKYSRKSHIDSLLKKCKGKFFKTIHEIMNTYLSITVKRLPQKFITNITIEYNQKYLKKNIIQIYQDFNLLPDYDTLKEKGLIKTNKKQPFEQFCTYNLMNLYNIYLESQRYFNEINEVKKHDGRRIGLLYQFVSKNFCNYFENNKPHILRAKEKIIHNNENLFIANNIINNDENNNNNNNGFCDINYNCSPNEC